MPDLLDFGKYSTSDANDFERTESPVRVSGQMSVVLISRRRRCRRHLLVVIAELESFSTSSRNHEQLLKTVADWENVG